MLVFRWLTLSAILCFSAVLNAETGLPEKLSFKQAMKIVDQANYYEALLAKAEFDSVAADLLSISGLNDFNIDAVALAQYVEASETAASSSNEDHKLAITLKKTLLDFGYSEAKQQSVESRQNAMQLLMKQIRLNKRIEVSRKFFNIKLADMKFAADNEAIATAYVKFRKTKDRNELKQSSDVDLLKAQFEYQQVRARRYESQTLKEVSRADFSKSIAKPKSLPEEVVIPEFSFLDRKRPEYETVLNLVLQNNLQLQAQKMLVEAANHELAASRKKGGSTLSSEIEWAEYSYETPSKNNWRAALKLSIPLYENDSVKSLRASALADLQKQRVRLHQLEADIRQQSYELWQRLYVLKAKQDVDEIAEEYRELYQDRSRAYYEMEFRTDLGDSFVRVSEAKLEKYKNNFELVMTWMKIAMLTGVTLEEYMLQ